MGLLYQSYQLRSALSEIVSLVTCLNLKASIAEIIGSEEAMDLFRHTTELGSHVRVHI